MLSTDGDRKLQPYLQSPFAEIQGRFSPNGRWVAYVSNETGRYEVYVQSFPASATKIQVSTEGGNQPRWRADGKELLFLGGISVPAKVTFVDVVESDGALKIGAPRTLFEVAVQARTRERNSWEVTPDGQRFLINGVEQMELMGARPIIVTVNWMRETVPGR